MRQPKVKNVVFDFFDVIHADPQKAWLRANGFELTGPFAEATHLLDNGTIGYADYITRYAHASGRSPEQVHHEFRSYYQVDHGTVKIIRALGESGFRLGLLSNTTTSEISPLLDGHELRTLFDTIVISSEVGLSKPDPEIFLYTLDLMSAEPGHTAYVDDNPNNVAAALSVDIAHGFPFTDSVTLMRDFARAGIHLDPFVAQ